MFCFLFYSSSILLYFPFYVVKIANRLKNTHPLSDHHEKALLEEDKALTEFDAQCKDIKKELEPSEAPKKELSKELEQSGAQKKETQLQKQLPQMVFLMPSTSNKLTWVEVSFTLFLFNLFDFLRISWDSAVLLSWFWLRLYNVVLNI